MAEKTRAELVAEVARRFGHYKTGTATGGSTTTVVDTAGLYAPDDYWVGHYVYILEDAGGGGAAPEAEERPVTDYDQGTATLTVDPAFTAAVASDDTYQVLAVRRAEIEAAINAAIVDAGLSWPVMTEDAATLTILANDYDYALPAGVVKLLQVSTRSGATHPWLPLAPGSWMVSGTPGAQNLQLSPAWALPVGDLVRLDYLARPAELTTDAGTLGVGEPAEREFVDFIYAYALFWLHDQMASAAPEGAGFRPHLTQAQYYLEMAERVRMRAGEDAGVVEEEKKGKKD